MQSPETQNSPESQIKVFEDLRGLNLSEKDLRVVPQETLVMVDFDTKTIWPGQDRMPAGFNPNRIMDEARNPGLGIKELHTRGIDGRGIRVAVIDQTLSLESGIMSHQEYASRIIDYKEFGDVKDEDISMHGPAVVSLLVGKSCGVAPGAEVVYRAVPSGRDFNYFADALLDIIESNRNLAPEHKVKVVSCSIGYKEDEPEPGLERWILAIKEAEEVGIIVCDVSSRTGVDYIGGGTSGNKDNPNEYYRPLFSKDTEDLELDKIFAESNGDIDLILQKIKKMERDEILDIPDSVLKEKIQKALDEREKEILIPCDYRTMASNRGVNEYMYNGKGGMSWSAPYLSGLYAMALQVNSKLKKDQIANAINRTATKNQKGLKVVNPKGFIEAISQDF